MSTSKRAWSLIAIPGRRQYGGNQGYNDDLTSTYRYDSDVPNSQQLSQGDLVLLRDRNLLLGIGLVERIISKPGMKKRFRCPQCKITTIKERLTLSPRWRCNNGHTFANPTKEEVPVTRYEAYYGSSYLSPESRISVSKIKSTVMRPSTQLSIEELNLVKLERILMRSFPEAEELILTFIQSISSVAEDADMEHQTSHLPYRPSLVDMRNRVLRPIMERRGQDAFRRKLLRRYGQQCMVSKCDLPEVLEAAHIWPYRGPKDNHVDNGLLLRADLHTLFDLDLLGIHPNTLCISMAENAKHCGYGIFHGKQLFVNVNQKPSRQALAKRWDVFSLACS